MKKTIGVIIPLLALLAITSLANAGGCGKMFTYIAGQTVDVRIGGEMVLIKFSGTTYGPCPGGQAWVKGKEYGYTTNSYGTVYVGDAEFYLTDNGRLFHISGTSFENGPIVDPETEVNVLEIVLSPNGLVVKPIGIFTDKKFSAVRPRLDVSLLPDGVYECYSAVLYKNIVYFAEKDIFGKVVFSRHKDNIPLVSYEMMALNNSLMRIFTGDTWSCDAFEELEGIPLTELVFFYALMNENGLYGAAFSIDIQ